MNPLTAKFMAPPCPATLPRPGIEAVMAAISQHRLTLIIAGAGYGKTTLTAQACEHLGLRQVWIRPDEKDRDSEDMSTKIATGVRLYFPDFHWPTSPPSVNGEKGLSIAHQFTEALESVLTADIFLIVENCHTLGPESCLFLQKLLDRFLPFFHLILVGRTRPEMRFTRLIAQGQVLRITAMDLAFSRKETREMISHLFGQPVSNHDIDLFWHKTRGVGIRDYPFPSNGCRQEKGCLDTGGPGEAIEGLKGSHGLIRDYFLENVYEDLENELGKFLLKTAILPRMDAEFCNAFLNMDKARDLLCRIEERTGFVTSLDEDRTRFSCHPLFREFLEDMIPSQLGPDQPKALYNRAARLFESMGLGRDALTYHILAGNIQDASRLMNRYARPVIKQDRPLMLKSLLSVIPAHYMDDEPWCQYLQAGYYGLSNQIKLAVNAYEKLLKIFHRKKDDQGECLVLMELAEHYLARGEIRQSEQAYTRILMKNRLDPYLTLVVMGHLIRVLALSGRPKEADKFAGKAVRLLDKLTDIQSLGMGRAWISVAKGYRHAFSGNYLEALDLGKDAKRLLSGLGRDRLLFSAYFLIAYSSFYLGRFSKGMDAARDGLALAREKGIKDEFTEFLRLMLAKNGLEAPGVQAKDIAVYQTEIRKSLTYFRTCAFPGGLAQGYLVDARAHLKQGQSKSAEKSMRLGLAAVRQTDMPLVKNELNVALSELLLYEVNEENKGEAFALLKAAEQELRHSAWHLAWISRIFARYYWNHGHKETAYKYMVFSLKTCQDESFDPWVVKEKDWAVPLLTHLYAMGSMAPYIETILAQIGPGVHHDLYRLSQHRKKEIKNAATQLMARIPHPSPPPIMASFFGRFHLSVGNRQIHTNQWKSRKALTLLKYLLAMGSKGYIEREILMELLWPEEDPQKSSQRFHVALAAVRKALEPQILPGIRSAYVKRSGQAYRIDITPKGRVDVDRFTLEIREGDGAPTPEKAMVHYTRAQSLYTGSFLEEEVYEHWCVRERDRYQEAFLSVLKKIMTFHQTRKAYGDAIITANTYLEIDPYAEGVIRRLMQYHSDAGNSPMVSRVFRNFSRIVRQEFDCSVSEKTQDLFNRLSRPKPEVWDTRMLESFKISGSL